MSSVTKSESGSSFFPIIIILSMVAATAIIIAPTYNDVKLRSHSIERHGLDAVMARLATRNCTNLKAYRCPSTEKHPPSFFLICEEPAGVMCTIMVVGTKGVELTSLKVPCRRAGELVSECQRAIVQ